MANNPTTCEICDKKQSSGNNKPHSVHKTKRKILPNIQKSNGQFLCTRCMRTKLKK